MDIIDLSAVPASPNNLESFLDQLCDRLALDYASYAVIAPFSDAVRGYANYPAAWKSHYMQRQLQNVDPILQKAALSIAPVDWSRFERDRSFKTVFYEATDFGISPQGLTVPIRGRFGDRGLLSVSRAGPQREWERLKRNIMPELQMAAVHLHDSVMRMSAPLSSNQQAKLSQREVEVLQWVAAGKQQQDIGDILSISPRTVEVHLRSAREKLGALTTFQAIGRAIALGVIFPV